MTLIDLYGYGLRLWQVLGDRVERWFFYFQKITFLEIFDMYLVIFDINSQYLIEFNQYLSKINQYSPNLDFLCQKSPNPCQKNPGMSFSENITKKQTKKNAPHDHPKLVTISFPIHINQLKIIKSIKIP